MAGINQGQEGIKPGFRHFGKLNLPMKQRIIEGARLGMSPNDCARLVRVDVTTMRNWMIKGEQDYEDDILSIHRELYEEFTYAEAEFVQRALTIWQTHWKDDWRAIEALLKRRFPKVWGDVAASLDAGSSDTTEALRVLLKSEELEAI